MEALYIYLLDSWHRAGGFFRLRDRVYQQDLGLSLGLDKANEIDKRSRFLILSSYHGVLGGARVTANERGMLPMECSLNFALRSFLPPELLCREAVEISHLAFHRSVRGMATMLAFSHAIVEAALNHGYRMLYAAQPALQARLTRFVCHELGIDVAVIKRLPVPPQSVYEKLGQIDLLAITKLDHLRDQVIAGTSCLNMASSLPRKMPSPVERKFRRG